MTNKNHEYTIQILKKIFGNPPPFFPDDIDLEIKKTLAEVEKKI